MRTFATALLSSFTLIALAGCNAGSTVPAVSSSSPNTGLPNLATATPTVPTNAPSAAATLAPGVSPAPAISAFPSAAPTGSPAIVATSAPTTVPTVAPTVAPTLPPMAQATAQPIPIYVPMSAPSNTVSDFQQTTGLLSHVQAIGFNNGAVDVALPPSNSNAVLRVAGYSAFDNSLPGISATNVVALVRVTSRFYSESYDANRVLTLTYKSADGIPSGAFHVAVYTPTSDVSVGWHYGFGTSSISGDTVTITYTLPTPQDFGYNDHFFAIYQ